MTRATRKTRSSRPRHAIASGGTPARAMRSLKASAQKALDQACARAEEAKAMTVDAVSHLEKVFEQRVSRAISRLGVPTAKDVRALSRQVAQLQQNVEQLHRARARSAR